MKGIYMFFANGFEETEALATADILKRGGVPVKMVSVHDDKYVTSAHNVTVITDMTYGEFKATTDFEASGKNDVMIFPGGMPGSTNLAAKKDLMDLMRRHYDEGGTVAAICAAPSVVLSLLPDISGKKMTCYDGFGDVLVGKGAEYLREGTVTDGRIITGRGPGFAFDFGFAILEYLRGKDAADEVRKGMLLL